MTTEDEFDLVSFIVGIMAGISLSLLSLEVLGISPRAFHAEAIEHGCAQYNQSTGEWEWK